MGSGSSSSGVFDLVIRGRSPGSPKIPNFSSSRPSIGGGSWSGSQGRSGSGLGSVVYEKGFYSFKDDDGNPMFGVDANWQQIYRFFKDKGYMLKDISNKIGCDFGKSLYHGEKMEFVPYRRLERLAQRNFENNLTPTKFNQYVYVKDEKLAEFVGIMLGDGHISKDGQSISIATNLKTEKNYRDYVEKLIERKFKATPGSNDNTSDNSGVIRLYRVGVVWGLERLGLKRGNKKNNQVSVPSWIKENPNFVKKCIKGLFDTDGCVFYHNRSDRNLKTIELNFSNTSRPLIDFFVRFCKSKDIYTGGNYKKGGTEIFIYSRKNVHKFAELIDSEKIKNWLKARNLTYEDLKTGQKY